jgi:hypothetical protein
MLFYRAALPLSSKTLNYTSGIIRRHRVAINSPWRRLNPGQQELLVLVYLRKHETFALLAAGFEVSTTTAWRYVGETVDLLTARVPKLRKAVREEANRAHAKLRGPGERANAQLKTWKILSKLRCCPGAPGNSPTPSTYCSSARHNQDEKALA